MKITKLKTFMANAGLRNYLFVQLVTDKGITGIGEASLEWQEKTVETILHEWVEDRILGKDPFAIEAVVGDMIRDQYQGGSTVMTAISAVEVAMWDIIGKSLGKPVYQLIGGRCHQKIATYANGWYGGSRTASEYAERAKEVIARGYRGLKFDPFGFAWKELSKEQADEAVELVATVRETVGDDVQLMIEFHGRLSATRAIEMIERLEPYHPVWCEEPVAPESLDLLLEVKQHSRLPISAGERLYTLVDFYRLMSLRAVDVVQMDISHCGGIWASKKVAAFAQAQDVSIAPHCSVGPVALAAALHFDVSTPNFFVQETFADFDVPWRNDMVSGWNPLKNGQLFLTDEPGLGLDIDEEVIADHPYQKNPFPSLWDNTWLKNFTQDKTGLEGI